MDKSRKPHPTIKIADVLKTGEKMGIEGEAIREYRAPGLQIHAYYLPVSHHGGDLYAIYYMQDGKTAFFIGDIAGHDFSSAIVAADVMSYVEKNHQRLLQPHKFLTRMGRDLHKKLFSLQRHMTAGIFLVDANNNKVFISTAGHPPSILYRGETNTVNAVGERSFPIGFDANVKYTSLSENFGEEDILLLYTDGVVSAKNADGEEFGVQPLEESLKIAGGESKQVIENILKRIKDFSSDEKAEDDRTLLCISRNYSPK